MACLQYEMKILRIYAFSSIHFNSDCQIFKTPAIAGVF